MIVDAETRAKIEQFILEKYGREPLLAPTIGVEDAYYEEYQEFIKNDRILVDRYVEEVQLSNAVIRSTRSKEEERVKCPSCGKDGALFGLDDKFRYHRHGMCARCFFGIK
jgi:hypothetical protein